MRKIPTRIHGIIDYAEGLLLIVAPWLLYFTRGGAETMVPVALGIGIIFYSLFTRYELGVWRLISMPVHLVLDVAGMAFLAASPWLFGFADVVWMPHLLIGLGSIMIALMTRTTTGVLIDRHVTVGEHAAEPSRIRTR